MLIHPPPKITSKPIAFHCPERFSIFNKGGYYESKNFKEHKQNYFFHTKTYLFFAELIFSSQDVNALVDNTQCAEGITKRNGAGKREKMRECERESSHILTCLNLRIILNNTNIKCISKNPSLIH